MHNYHNNLPEIIDTIEGLETRPTGTWGYCNICPPENNAVCTKSIAIFVDEENPFLELIVSQKNKQNGWIKLKKGITFLCYCIQANANLRIVRTEEERNWFFSNDYIVIYTNGYKELISLDLSSYTPNNDDDINFEIDREAALYNPSIGSLLKIKNLTLIVNKNALPTESTFAKLNVLCKYLKGKKGNRYLPFKLKISEQQQTRQEMLKVHYLQFRLKWTYVLEAWPEDISENGSEAGSSDSGFADTLAPY